MDEFRTETGRVLTDSDFQRLADEAEEGYDIDPSKGRACICPRREDLTIIERLADCPIHGKEGRWTHVS